MKNHVDVVHISHVKEERGQSGTMISFCFSSCSFSHLVLSVIAICMREANKCIDRQKTRLPGTRRHRAASSTRRACLPWVVLSLPPIGAAAVDAGTGCSNRGRRAPRVLRTSPRQQWGLDRRSGVANKKVASDLRNAVGAEKYKCVAQGFRG